MKTWHIHIEGLVQGVGFRPFVYKVANEQNLSGWVNNGVDGVHIRLSADKENAEAFKRRILENPPPHSRIMNHSIRETTKEEFKDFTIIESNQKGKPNLLMTPDFGMCPDCEKELFSKEDRRYNYPFITCTNCGPRYSIIESLPYDRPRTTMEGFDMCKPCAKEYNDPMERRHFSQTNSCGDCGINLCLEEEGGVIVQGESESVIDRVCDLISKGKIIGIKGIGGYLIFADATNQDTIKLLRQRKGRPSKPFALMYPDAESIKEDTEVLTKELERIFSVESPIVLLRVKETIRSGINTDLIAPGLNEIGVMRPYTPLFALIMKKVGKPAIATSGNVSGSPVIFRDEIARGQLFDICDYILSNDREIVAPQDDSVMKVLEDETPLILRRSRGIAPTFIEGQFKSNSYDMIAMGAMLKSTFALIHQQNTYVSQYLGDLESYDTQESYNHTLNHFFELFKPNPEKILVDMHPGYYSTTRGIEISDQLGIPVKQIQHHEAHLMAVIAENSLQESNERILGVIWDGTGLGNDQQIWGGEYFIYDNNTIDRIDHIPYFDHILGDKFAKDTRLPALSLCHSFCLNKHSLESRFSRKEWKLYNKILDKGSDLKTSSVGRLFDGVSSMLGISKMNSFEGEAAMHLQSQAERFARNTGMIDNTFISLSGGLEQCLNELMIGANAGVETGRLAYDFHNWFVNQVKNKAEENNIEKIVFSGGVFQNSLLLHLLKERLSSEFELYFHKGLSPNDESISYGQLAYEISGAKSKQSVEEQQIINKETVVI